MIKITVKYQQETVNKIKKMLPTYTELHDLLDRNSYEAGSLLIGAVKELSDLANELNISSVQLTNDEPECHACGDMGRCNPTLENPDGVVCPCVVGEP